MIENIQQYEIIRSFKYNFIVNLFEGGFFGLAMGLSSYQTILPLFISNFTDSAILIGLIPAIHIAGWQLPQLFLANRVAKQKHYKPMVLVMTVHERLPFLGLALVAWFLPGVSPAITLLLVYLLLIWQGLGSGVTAIGWQSMMGKLILPHRWGTFFGLQSSFFNLFGAAGAVFAGYILVRNESPWDFTLCFLLAFIIMVISYFLLIMVREPERIPVNGSDSDSEFRMSLKRILKTNKNFRWYLVGRMLAGLAVMGFAFYTVYAVKEKGVSELTVGWMTALLMGIQILINPVLGWIGDRWNRQIVMVLGMLTATISSVIAIFAPTPDWFYLVFLLAGIANVSAFTIGISMTLDFTSEEDRPAYIGLSNTLIAPANILLPFLGGWLADFAGYPAAFIASAVGGLASVFVFLFLVKDPKKHRLLSQTLVEVS